MRNIDEKVRIEIEDLPELDTEVAVSGTSRQQEVGGVVCVGIAAGIAIYAMT